MNSLVLGILLAFASPLLLWPIEQILPWPFIIEEMVKAIVVVMIINQDQDDHRINLGWPVIAGVLFTLSETVFYLFNFLKLGDFSDLPKRIILTGTLHIGTIVLIYLGAQKRPWGLLVGFLVAVVIHYLFNLFIA